MHCDSRLFRVEPTAAMAWDRIFRPYCPETSRAFANAVCAGTALPSNSGLPGALFVVGAAIRVGKSEPSGVTYKIPVHITVVAGLHAHDPAVMGVPDRIAPQRAVVAKGGRSLEVPSAHFEPGGLVGVDAGRADIHQVSRKRAFELAVRKPAEVETVPDLHGTEISVSGKLLVKPGTAVAMDAPVHFMLNVRSQVLVPIRSLFAPISADAVPAGHMFHPAAGIVRLRHIPDNPGDDSSSSSSITLFRN